MTRPLVCRIPVECELRFRLGKGGQLVWARGNVACSVSFAALQGAKDTDVAVELDVADLEGRVFKQARTLRGSHLFELLRMAEVCTSIEGATPLVSGVQCLYDRRAHMTAVAKSEQGYRAVAYWMEHLAVTLDLFALQRKPWDWLAIRVRPAPGRGIGYDNVPEVMVQTEWYGVAIIWPSLLSGLTIDDREGVFVETNERGRPQPLVSVVGQ